jgi:UDP-N-acetylglucosamine:LPS N-acetylglucosamine transferase
VLIVSATVGAGDQGNARELARRLQRQGHRAQIRDFLDAAPLRTGKVLAKGYEAELRHAPWAYELAFGVWFWMPWLLPPLAALLSVFTRRRILRWVREQHADVVVSTYPLATQVLGHLRTNARRRWRRRSALRVPVANFITDFGFHPFWANRGVDLNLAVHPGTVAAVAKRTGKPSVACGPLVAPPFAVASERRRAQRARLGLEHDELAVLISSGSWGVGAVRETFELVASRPGLVPVVACGHNTALRNQLEELARTRGYRALLIGWTDDMAGLMAACDVLVENAGGLTSLEAMRAKLPLVSFHPIPGHGRNSAAAMTAAGVSRWARSQSDLLGQVEQLGRPGHARQAQLAAAAALFSQDAALQVAKLGSRGPVQLLPLRPAVRVARSAATVGFGAALGWAAITVGVSAAAAAGIGVAHPPAGANDAIYLGVRLSPQELASPAVRSALVELDASAVVAASTAQAHPSEVRALVDMGIEVDSGGRGTHAGRAHEPYSPWGQALWDSRSVQEIDHVTDRHVRTLVPDRSISAFDLYDASKAHLLMVVPNTTLPGSSTYPRGDLALPAMRAGRIYVVNGWRTTPGQLVTLLGSIEAELAHQGLTAVSFGALR